MQFQNKIFKYINVSEATYEKHTVENMKSATTPNVIAANPLDHLDCKNCNSDVSKIILNVYCSWWEGV